MSAVAQRRSLGDILDRSYRGRRVLVTGHNGFVGSWLSYWLTRAGAEVVGLALPTEPGGLAAELDLASVVSSIEGDVRDSRAVGAVLRTYRPEVVFHLAAQALVIPSFDDPLGTFATNVMGTAHVLDAVRSQPSVRACVVITSDKCYATASGAHVESDPLGGDDPYSASKGAAELIAHAFRHSFFANGAVGIATARAGNIVGGGDWAANRIVPDCARAVRAGKAVRLRHPGAVRPWQHVLDAVAGYLRLGDALLTDPAGYSRAWNFGPSPESAATVADVVSLFLDRWRAVADERVADAVHDGPVVVPERAVLTLVSTAAQSKLDWRQLLDLRGSIAWTADWYHEVLRTPGNDAATMTVGQITRYLELDRASGGDATRVDDQASAQDAVATSVVKG